MTFRLSARPYGLGIAVSLALLSACAAPSPAALTAAPAARSSATAVAARNAIDLNTLADAVTDRVGSVFTRSGSSTATPSAPTVIVAESVPAVPAALNR